MLKTLIVSVASECQYSCPLCPFKHSTEASLSPQSLQSLMEKIESVDNLVVSCSSWLKRRDTDLILEKLRDKARRISLLLPMGEVGGMCEPGKILSQDLASDILLIASQDSAVPVEDLRKTLSRTDAALGVWFISQLSYSSYRAFKEIFPKVKDLGLRLLIGETPYSYSSSLDPIVFVLRVGGESVGLPFGTRYGYKLARAYIEGYPATLLIRPLQLSGTLYVSPGGEVAKHPRSEAKVRIEEISMDSLRRIIYMPEKMPGEDFFFEPEVQVVLRERVKGVEIDQKTIQLLEAIQAFNSLKAACRSTGLPYSSCVERIATVEKKLGRKLVVTSRGGRLKGRSFLSELGLQILENYRKIIFKISEEVAK